MILVHIYAVQRVAVRGHNLGRFWIISVILALIGLASLKLR